MLHFFQNLPTWGGGSEISSRNSPSWMTPFLVGFQSLWRGFLTETGFTQLGEPPKTASSKPYFPPSNRLNWCMLMYSNIWFARKVMLRVSLWGSKIQKLICLAGGFLRAALMWFATFSKLAVDDVEKYVEAPARNKGIKYSCITESSKTSVPV